MNKKTVIITGINGFVGKHLARELVHNNYSVIGIGNASDIEPEIGELLEEYICKDISKGWPEIEKNIDSIVNLAALAVVGSSFKQPQDYININSAIVTNMCEYYVKKERKPRILSISSGTVYSPFQKMPIKENSDILFSSPYVISKILNENQLIYYRSLGLDCISARPFNHIGPGQLSGFLVPDLVGKIIEAQNKDMSYIETGNIKTRRDYTDVRDVVRAYRLIIESTTLNHSVYNICSGKSHSGEEIFKLIQNITNINDITYKINPNKIRPNDAMDIVGDYSRLQSDTGWSPQVSLTETIEDIVKSY